MQGRLVSGSWTPQCLFGSNTLPERKDGDPHQAGPQMHHSLTPSLPPLFLHYISLKAPSLSLSFCSSAAAGGPAHYAFTVPTNRTDVARSDKSLLTGSTGSLTRVNCDCQPGETLTLPPFCRRFNERNPAGGPLMCANTSWPCRCQGPARCLQSERHLRSQRAAAGAKWSPELCCAVKRLEKN